MAFGYHRSADEAQGTLAEVRALGALATRSRSTSTSPRRATVEQAAAALGGIDVFVYSSRAGFAAQPDDVDEALWEEAIGSTLKGGFFCAQAARRRWRAGRIVFITDVAGIEPWLEFAPHGAAKAGLVT